MPVVSAEEWQLLSFFEVEPSMRDSDVPWCYNDALYEVSQGDLSLSFALTPAYHDVRLMLRFRGESLYKLHTTDVKDVKYQKDEGREQLTIEVNERDAIDLCIKPRIEIRHRVEQRS